MLRKKKSLFKNIVTCIKVCDTLDYNKFKWTYIMHFAQGIKNTQMENVILETYLLYASLLLWDLVCTPLTMCKLQNSSLP